MLTLFILTIQHSYIKQTEPDINNTSQVVGHFCHLKCDWNDCSDAEFHSIKPRMSIVQGNLKRVGQYAYAKPKNREMQVKMYVVYWFPLRNV